MSTLLSNTIKPRSGDTVTFSSCNVSVGGTVTYEDVTNVDSVGIITARTGLKVTAGGIDVTAGGIDVTAGGIDVTAGIVTARTGLKVTAGGIDVTAGGIDVTAGIVTARSGIEIGAAGVGGTITSVGNVEFAGVTTSKGNLNVGSAITSYAATGIVSATAFYGDGSNLSGTGGITSAQQFRIAADLSGSSSQGTVLIGWEEVDTDYQAIGSNWSQSSGIFSCSATGIYLCSYTMVIGNTTVEDSFDPNVQISTDSGSNYTTRSRTWGKVVASDLNQQDSPSNSFMVNVSNTSTFRLRYRQSQDNALDSNTTISGSSTETLTNIMFIRLGDT